MCPRTDVNFDAIVSVRVCRRANPGNVVAAGRRDRREQNRVAHLPHTAPKDKGLRRCSNALANLFTFTGEGIKKFSIPFFYDICKEHTSMRIARECRWSPPPMHTHNPKRNTSAGRIGLIGNRVTGNPLYHNVQTDRVGSLYGTINFRPVRDGGRPLVDIQLPDARGILMWPAMIATAIEIVTGIGDGKDRNQGI
ncbi:hypothetical protein EVAR_78940_1 [Eumeta japonica]|uniref:Uncharacterized protein n=1 Tax=Eumeta variegata TaxID=151549 RepID=A0A4C1U2L7_EUMVA|nr:hypothetical protein EVAR_78940_1 [Eumeta japonica]